MVYARIGLQLDKSCWPLTGCMSSSFSSSSRSSAWCSWDFSLLIRFYQNCFLIPNYTRGHLVVLTYFTPTFPQHLRWQAYMRPPLPDEFREVLREPSTWFSQRQREIPHAQSILVRLPCPIADVVISYYFPHFCCSCTKPASPCVCYSECTAFHRCFGPYQAERMHCPEKGSAPCWRSLLTLFRSSSQPTFEPLFCILQGLRDMFR